MKQLELSSQIVNDDPGGLNQSRDVDSDIAQAGPVTRMIRKLVNLEAMSLSSITFERPVLATLSTMSPASSITSLNLELTGYHQVELILPSFPRLEHLQITVDVQIDHETDDIISIFPARQLYRLEIEADFNSAAIRKLIADTEAIECSLEGYHANKALKALRDSQHMESLSFARFGHRDDEGEDIDDLDELLLKFTQLEQLNLGAIGSNVSDQFFANYFKASLPLVVLVLSGYFPLYMPDLIQASENTPTGLKEIVLDYLGNPDDFSEEEYESTEGLDTFDADTTRALIDLYQTRGVQISGTAVRLLPLVESQRAAGQVSGFGEWGGDDDEQGGTSY